MCPYSLWLPKLSPPFSEWPVCELLLGRLRKHMFRIIADKKNPNLSEYKHLLKTLDCTSEIDTFWLDEIAKL